MNNKRSFDLNYAPASANPEKKFRNLIRTLNVLSPLLFRKLDQKPATFWLVNHSPKRSAIQDSLTKSVRRDLLLYRKPL